MQKKVIILLSLLTTFPSLGYSEVSSGNFLDDIVVSTREIVKSSGDYYYNTLTSSRSYITFLDEKKISFYPSMGYGVGLRYAILNVPLPLIGINLTMGNSTLFLEGVGSAMMISGSIGYSHKIYHNSSLHVARVEAGSIGEKASGYKIGYVYNSNEYHKKGWETSIELYSVTTRSSVSTNTSSPSKHLFPSISVGYHWY